METIFAVLLSVHSSDANTGGNGKGAKGYSRGTHSLIRLRICSTERHHVHSRKPTKMMKEAQEEETERLSADEKKNIEAPPLIKTAM